MLTHEAVDYTSALERPEPENLEIDDDNRRLAGLVLSQFDRYKKAKEKRTRIWELLNAYHKGDQYLYRDVTTGEVVRMQDKVPRKRAVTNKMNLASRALKGKLKRHFPNFTVTPASGDQDQMQAAMAATAFIDFFKYKEQFDVLMGEVYQDVARVGNGFWELLWDVDAGRELAMCDDCGFFEEDPELIGSPCPACEQEAVEAVMLQGEAQSAEDAAALMETGALPPEQAPIEKPAVPVLESVREGDAVAQYLDPWEFFPEPACKYLHKMRAWFIYRVQPVSELCRRHPDFAPYIRAESGLYDGSTVRTVSATADVGHDELDDHAAELVYHEMPSVEYPEGRMVTVINDVVVEDIDSPYYKLFGRPNVFRQHWERENDSFWADAWAEQAWPSQKELNETESTISEHTASATQRKVLNPIGSQINATELTSQTMQVLKYNPAAGRVEALQLPDLNQSVYERRATLTEDIYSQAGVTPHEAGLTPQDESGRAIAIVESQGDAQIEPIMVPNRAELAEFWKCVILLVRAKSHPDRQFRILGDTDGLQQFCLREMNLEPGFDLRLEQDDGLSNIQSVRINQLLEIQAGTMAFGDPAMGGFDLPRFAKAAKIKLPGIGPDMSSVEHTAAEAMLKQIEGGDFTVQPMPWDDPNIFAEHLQSWLKTNGRLPDTDQMVLQHVYALFEYYVQWALVGMQPPVAPGAAGGMPGAGSGGTPGQPGAMAGTGGSVEGGGSPGASAASRVQSADAAGEMAARMSLSHEN